MDPMGVRLESETQLSYMYHRYYSSGLGRFLSVDPAQVKNIQRENVRRSAAANSIDVSLGSSYVYAWNNPLLWIDPEGLWAAPAAAVVAYVYLAANASCANSVRQQLSGMNGDYGWKHCLAICLIAQKCGRLTAEDAGWVREIGQGLGEIEWGDVEANYDGLNCFDELKCASGGCDKCCQQKGRRP